MQNYPELEFNIDGITPVSTNEMYAYGRKTVRKSTKYKAYETEVLLKVRPALIGDSIKEFRDCLSKDYRRAINVTYEFQVPKRTYFRVDTSNYIKAIEDIIKSFIDIDDSRNVKLSANKVLSKDKLWHIHIKLQIYDLEYDIPKDKWTKTILGTGKLQSRIGIKPKIKPLKSKVIRQPTKLIKQKTSKRTIKAIKPLKSSIVTKVEMVSDIDNIAVNNLRLKRNLEPKQLLLF